MAAKARMKWLLTTLALLSTFHPAMAQTVEEWRQRLVDHPLYLRGFWMGYDLEFDSEGKPAGKHASEVRPGPLTLSGVNVTAVSISKKQMLLSAERVALATDASGHLTRKPIVSFTHMEATVQRFYKSNDVIRILVHADASGSFEAPIRFIFADGLEQLAASAPPYWICYAKAYFHENVDGNAQQQVENCVRQPALELIGSGENDTPSQISVRAPVRAAQEAMALIQDGECSIRLIIGPHGVPLHPQIMRAVGAGLDEAVLQAITESQFKPATSNGTPMASMFTFSVRFADDQNH